MSVFVVETVGAGGGTSLAVKDSIDVAGLPTALGSAAYANVAPAESNAEVVNRLLAANYDLKGKLAMHELAFGMTGINHFSGTPINPLYPDYIPGGSSSGSAAAVASGVVEVALGTDTGGSIRLPAACCGVFGFKPTFGRVSRQGVLPQNSSLDCVGPMACSVELIEQCMEVIASDFVRAPDIEKCFLGVLSLKVDRLVEDVFNESVFRLIKQPGISAKPVILPGFDNAFDAGMVLISAEAVNAFGHLPSEQLGEDVARRLAAARDISPEKIEQAKAIQEKFTEEVSELLTEVDVLILPTLPHFPLLKEKALNGEVDLNLSRLVRPFNVSGHPAITIPLATDENVPIALQLVAAKGRDEFLCATARRLAALVNLPNFGN